MNKMNNTPRYLPNLIFAEESGKQRKTSKVPERISSAMVFMVIAGTKKSSNQGIILKNPFKLAYPKFSKLVSGNTNNSNPLINRKMHRMI